MKVILLSDLWTGILPVIFEGSEKPTGMPAFFNTFSKLNSDGNVESVECHFFAPRDKIKGPVLLAESFSEKTTVKVYGYANKFHLLFLASWLILSLTLRLLISKKSKTVLYGHGAIGTLAGFVSMFSNVPNVRRIYGTFLVDIIDRSNFKMFLTYPLAYMAFSLPHKYLVVTNDGTHGNKVYRKICGADDSKLKFLVNGVDLSEEKWNRSSSGVISYIARIDQWKNQLLAIQAFGRSDYLKKNFRLVIAGPTYNREYYQKLVTTAKDLGVASSVEFAGSLSRDGVNKLLKDSDVTLSLYDTSNFGNVLIEAIQMGVPLITRNINDSLSVLPVETYIAVSAYSVSEVSESIENSLMDRDLLYSVSEKARSHSRVLFTSWDNRAQLEIDLLLDN